MELLVLSKSLSRGSEERFWLPRKFNRGLALGDWANEQTALIWSRNIDWSWDAKST